MTIKSTLLKAGALYALGRLTSDITMNDVRRWSTSLTGINQDDVLRYASDTTDDLLDRVGLQRQRSATAASTLVLGGIGAGLLLGAGLGLLFASESGRELREKIVERVSSKRSSNGAEASPETGVSGMSS